MGKDREQSLSLHSTMKNKSCDCEREFVHQRKTLHSLHQTLDLLLLQQQPPLAPQPVPSSAHEQRHDTHTPVALLPVRETPLCVHRTEHGSRSLVCSGVENEGRSRCWHSSHRQSFPSTPAARFSPSTSLSFSSSPPPLLLLDCLSVSPFVKTLFSASIVFFYSRDPRVCVWM